MQKEEERTTPAVIRHGALQMWRWLRALMHLREAPLHSPQARRQRRCAAAKRHRARQLATAAKESGRAASHPMASMER